VLPRAADATITFKVSSPYLTADASAETEACLSTPGPSRKLLAGTNYTVSTAGTMTYTVKIGDGAAEDGVVENGVGGKITIGGNDHEVSRNMLYSYYSLGCVVQAMHDCIFTSMLHTPSY
jgi:hypothetical protein